MSRLTSSLNRGLMNTSQIVSITSPIIASSDTQANRSWNAAVRRHGFGRRPYFETLICRRDGRAIGLALYFFTYSTFLGQPTLYL